MSGVGLSLLGSVADRWRELSGKNNWKGLLDPLDIDLRRCIINYGDNAGARGDAFNDRKISDCRGFSRYPPEEFYSKLGIALRNPYKYSVTDFFYARSEIKIINWLVADESSWIGHVAVATEEGKELLGRRDIVVAWGGTILDIEKIDDLEAILVPASDIFGPANGPEVHQGFHSLYTAKNDDSTYNKTSAREQVLAAVKRLVEKYKDEEVSITVTGHSLGGALATLNAMDIVANGYNKPSGNTGKAFPVTVFVAGSPRVGNDGFKKVFDGLLDLHVLRVANANDPVPNLPTTGLGYVHVGEQVNIDTSQSPYLTTNSSPHNLDLYLHGVAGSQGTNGGFKLEVDLDIALVNKYTDALKEDYDIPANWWVMQYRDLVQTDDGSFKRPSAFYVPDPPS